MHSKFFVIWGMHRGGTSLLAGAMRVFGAEACGRQLPADRYNPRGYFENQELMGINEAMFSELGQRWYSLGSIGHEQLEILIKSGHLDKAIQFLKAQASEAPVVLLKDPRMARLGLLWQKAFADIENNPYSVVVWRDPRAVAASLRTRAQNLKFPAPVIDERYSYILWLEYMYAALLYTAPYPRALVNYDQFLSAPAASLKGIASTLQFPLSENGLGEFCNTFVDSGLNHYPPHESALPMPDKVHAMYELLSTVYNWECPHILAKAWQPTDEEKLMAALLDSANGKIRENAAKMASIHSEICVLTDECKRMALELSLLKK